MVTGHAGAALREWRHRRRLSQLELANRAGVSTRHLSFVETGRSRPSSSLVLTVCEHLKVPLREQNQVLMVAGHAPVHPEHGLTSAPMREISTAIEGILQAYAPWPALVVDRRWDLVSANDGLYRLLDGVAEHLLEPPVNVIRLSLAPDGLAPLIVNLDEWRGHLLDRLRREHEISADKGLADLLEDLGEDPESGPGLEHSPPPGLLVPLRLRLGGEVLSFISTTTVFGTPREVTLSELAIEAFHPADARTRALLDPAS